MLDAQGEEEIGKYLQSKSEILVSMILMKREVLTVRSYKSHTTRPGPAIVLPPRDLKYRWQRKSMVL